MLGRTVVYIGNLTVSGKQCVYHGYDHILVGSVTKDSLETTVGQKIHIMSDLSILCHFSIIHNFSIKLNDAKFRSIIRVTKIYTDK